VAASCRGPELQSCVANFRVVGQIALITKAVALRSMAMFGCPHGALFRENRRSPPAAPRAPPRSTATPRSPPWRSGRPVAVSPVPRPATLDRARRPYDPDGRPNLVGRDSRTRKACGSGGSGRYGGSVHRPSSLTPGETRFGTGYVEVPANLVIGCGP
jgi:hypothetical protein